MKVFIWLVSLFVFFGLPYAIAMGFGIEFGAIPTIVLAGTASYIARTLCKKWVNYKTSKLNNNENNNISVLHNFTETTNLIQTNNIEKNTNTETSFDFFSKFPTDILLTSDSKILHTDTTMDNPYGKYSVFVDKKYKTLHLDACCKTGLKASPSYTLQQEYSEYNLCSQCCTQDKNSYKDLFLPEWYSNIQKLNNDVIVFKTQPSPIQNNTLLIKKLFKSNYYIKPNDLKTLPALLLDYKNNVVIDNNNQIYHIDASDSLKYGKYTLYDEPCYSIIFYFSKRSGPCYHTHKHQYIKANVQLPSYKAIENKNFYLCPSCKKKTNKSEYDDIFFPRWYTSFSKQ